MPHVIDINKVDVITLDDSEDDKCSKDKEDEDTEENINEYNHQIVKTNDYNRKANMSDSEEDQYFTTETDNTVSSSTSIVNKSSTLEDSISSDSEMMYSSKPLYSLSLISHFIQPLFCFILNFKKQKQHHQSGKRSNCMKYLEAMMNLTL